MKTIASALFLLAYAAVVAMVFAGGHH